MSPKSAEPGDDGAAPSRPGCLVDRFLHGVVQSRAQEQGIAASGLVLGGADDNGDESGLARIAIADAQRMRLLNEQIERQAKCVECERGLDPDNRTGFCKTTTRCRMLNERVRVKLKLQGVWGHRWIKDETDLSDEKSPENGGLIALPPVRPARPVLTNLEPEARTTVSCIVDNAEIGARDCVDLQTSRRCFCPRAAFAVNAVAPLAPPLSPLAHALDRCRAVALSLLKVPPAERYLGAAADVRAGRPVVETFPFAGFSIPDPKASLIAPLLPVPLLASIPTMPAAPAETTIQMPTKLCCLPGCGKRLRTNNLGDRCTKSCVSPDSLPSNRVKGTGHIADLEPLAVASSVVHLAALSGDAELAAIKLVLEKVSSLTPAARGYVADRIARGAW
jgi:hypothetical protein